jgi:DNA mismatch repair ATPase MutS
VQAFNKPAIAVFMCMSRPGFSLSHAKSPVSGWTLANEKDFNLVATHDLQLSEKLNDKYQNFHFQEKICNDGLSFDYKIQPGISTSRNAIALLKYVGYPDSIVENAYNRINTMENAANKKTWNPT